MKQKIITVVGGAGFIGNYLVDSLLNSGYYVKIVSRNPESKKIFYPSAKLGQYSLIKCNICDVYNLTKAIKGSSCVINLVGLLVSKGKNNFHEVHVNGAENLVKACKGNNIKKLIHISAIGVNKNKKSRYALTKHLAEKNC